MTTPTGRAVPRRAFLSVAALLAPGFFDRLAAATIASAPEAEPEPEPAREKFVAIGPCFYRIASGPAGPEIRVAERAEALAGRPEAKPVGHRIYRHQGDVPGFEAFVGGWSAEFVWADDPFRSCRLCRLSCNASLHKQSGEWRCHVIGGKTDYQGPVPTAEAPGFLGYY